MPSKRQPQPPRSRAFAARLASVCVLAVVAWSSLPAHAFGSADTDLQACRSDARQFCKGERPGGGRIVACLQQHEADLSADCKAKLPEIAACSGQLKQVCGDAGTPRALKRCAAAHKAELTACGKAEG